MVQSNTILGVMNMGKRKSILELTYHEAKDFFLKHESYCNIDLPRYFSFSDVLEKVSKALSQQNSISQLKKKNSKNGYVISDIDDVNHLLYANKDGKLSWRPLQIIHPLVYVLLVHEITKKDNWEKLKARFLKFQQNNKIECLSIPVKSENKQSDKAQQISNWWEKVEQQSILYSLEYSYIFDTDIADCYGSVYTHAIAWAVEGKKNAKQTKKDKTLGNYIDTSIQYAQYGQTNGIPQGSVLMDFIAEIILGYIDSILNVFLRRKKITDYKILRYRDDYRIFVNNPNDGENILKLLSEIMMPFGFKLNSSKTKGSQDIISQSIKKDKLAWLEIPQNNRGSLQKKLLLIRQHSINFPNSGSLNTALNIFDTRLEKMKKPRSIEQLISIVTDIAYHNPKVIPVSCSIISKLLDKLDDNKSIAQLVYQKLSRMPNSGFSQIWLQRMLKSDLTCYSFSEEMCKLSNMSLWNNSWINDNNMVQILNNTPIFKQDEFDKLNNIILNSEIDIFYY